MRTRIKWSLVGISDHQGVFNVGGRIGAAAGPAEFRQKFERLKGQMDVRGELEDFGDVSSSPSGIEATHLQARRRVAEAHRKAGLSVVIGGGHDHGASHLAGIADSLKKNARIGCINIDAHLDVRKPSPAITSGSPFYLAIESGVLIPSRFVEFGIQIHCNGPELWDFCKKNRIKIVPFEALRRQKAVPVFQKVLRELSTQSDVIIVSFDLDSVASSAAPGVSSPQAEGFSPSEVIEMLEIAGSNKKVVSLGIFELNPIHDIDGKTSNLAATAAYHFIYSRGLLQ